MAIQLPIVHNKYGSTQILSPLTPQRGGDGLDTASMVVDFWADNSVLPQSWADKCTAAYLGKTAPAHASMYCVEVDPQEVFAGWVTARITYKGFWEGEPKISVSERFDANEELFPFSVGNMTYSYGRHSKQGGTGTVFNPDTGQPWRVSILSPQHMVSRSGVEIREGSTTFPLPDLSAGTPAPTGQPNYSQVEDPLIHINFGWVRVNGGVTHRERLTSTATAFFWQDTHLYIPQFTR